jgi:hypothetical protein
MIEYYDKNTKTLIIPHRFSEELKDIPEETEIIIFSENKAKNECSIFNQPVDNLPKNLTHLTFGYEFNQPVDNLPKTLTHLSFGSCFNQSLNKLPENLIFLKLGLNFQQDVILPQK